jgi:hypothetical protein
MRYAIEKKYVQNFAILASEKANILEWVIGKISYGKYSVNYPVPCLNSQEKIS